MLPAHRKRLLAHVDDEIGIGADKRQSALNTLLDQRPVGFDRMVDLVHQAGADDGVGLRERRIGTRQARKQPAVAAGRAHTMQAPVSFLRDVRERDVAGAYDRVPGVAPHARFFQHAFDPFGGDRRIRDQHHRAALAAKARQSCAGLGMGRAAVVHDAPNVAEDGLVARQQRAGVGKDRRRHGAAISWDLVSDGLDTRLEPDRATTQQAK